MERHVLTPEQLNATTICWILCEQIDPRDWRRLFFPWIGMFLLPVMLILWVFVFNCGKDCGFRLIPKTINRTLTKNKRSIKNRMSFNTESCQSNRRFSIKKESV